MASCTTRGKASRKEVIATPSAGIWKAPLSALWTLKLLDTELALNLKKTAKGLQGLNTY